ncbi:MAG: hypothetical protein H0U04_17270 [Rubrobacter sp.]|nr:hypothetical protein [Rubrobacter sp.]
MGELEKRESQEDISGGRELEAPWERPEAPEAPETVEQEPEGTEPRPDAPGRQEGARRPWWRRVFGG